MQSETGLMPSDIRTLTKKLSFLTISIYGIIHAKSYSSIFSTLNTKSEIKKFLNGLIRTISFRKSTNHQWNLPQWYPLEKKVGSGLELPLFWFWHHSLPKITNWRMLLKSPDLSVDESVLRYYTAIPTWFQWITWRRARKLKIGCTFLHTLWKWRRLYRKPYDGAGWTGSSENILRYNANKALMNLGQDPLLPWFSWRCQPYCYERISTAPSNHDFFKLVVDIYLVKLVMQDDDS